MAGWTAADCCVLWPGKAGLGGRENLGFWCPWPGWNVDYFALVYDPAEVFLEGVTQEQEML